MPPSDALNTAVRELAAAKVEMASCGKADGPCPAMSNLIPLDLADSAERTRSAGLTMVSTAIGTMEGCFGTAMPCRAHYLLKDVFLRMAR